MLILFLGLTFSSADDSRLIELSKTRYWQKILHYRKRFPAGGKRSLVDGQGFFLAEDGKTNPYSELSATVEAFKSGNPLRPKKIHPQCLFPERYRLLKERGVVPEPAVSCPEVDAFLATFKNFENVSMVFSSAYPNNPASMFGHTFLKFAIKGVPEMLFPALNYAAHLSEDDNFILFATFGIFGGYEGRFILTEYHKKLNEYANTESRDLWEYELNLDKDQVIRMLLNIWEVEHSSYIDYFFLDENCSFIILEFLEVANPDWNFGDWPLYVVPNEALKRLARQPGAVRKISFKPAFQKMWRKAFAELSNEQKKEVLKLVDENSSSKESSTDALSLAVQIYRYRKYGKDGHLSESEDARYKELLLERSKRPIEREKKYFFPETTKPDLGHWPYKTSFGLGMNTGRFFQEAALKLAYHDFLNNDLGYSEHSKIDFPEINLRWYSSQNLFRIERLHLLTTTSLYPLDALEMRPSFHVSAELFRPLEREEPRPLNFKFESGAGAALSFFDDHMRFGIIPGLRIDVHENYGLGPVVHGFLTLSLSRLGKILLNPYMFWETRTGVRIYGGAVGLSFFLSQDSELRLLTNNATHLQTDRSGWDTSLTYNVFF